MHGVGAIEAYSAGSKPSGQVDPKAITAMRELGYDLSRHVSKSLSEIPAIEYDAAVTMGCGDACQNVHARKREEWNIPDPKALPTEEFRKVRGQIEQKVRELLARLA
jgi:arsenate reductase (thioredoxin)